jgi:hypothetical protein
VVASRCLQTYFPYDNSNNRNEDNIMQKCR